MIAVPTADGIYVPPIPKSEAPVWLDSRTIRFESDFEAYQKQPNDFALVPYVIGADGSGVRPATAAEAQQAPASPPPGEKLEFGFPATALDAPLFVVDAQGQRHLIEASAYEPAGAALSPDGRTVVFAEWVGQHNADSIALYAVPTDGSSEPRRLTATSCTLFAGGPLGGICFDGTDGPDTVVGTKYGDLIIGGSGNDTIRAGDGLNWIESQWGNDDIRSGSNDDFVLAGPGDDVIRTGSGRDYIYPGPGHDSVFAGTGPDLVVANDGERDTIDCGPGDDRVTVDRIDVTRNCEHVSIAPPEPDPTP